MDKTEALNLVKEALHSYRMLHKYMGSDANGMLLKWPDAFESFLTDEKLFKKDIALLICIPIKTIIEFLVQMRNEKYKDGINTKEVEDVMKLSEYDPLTVKTTLVRIAEGHLQSLHNRGEFPCVYGPNPKKQEVKT